jgi:hypothetical protein
MKTVIGLFKSALLLGAAAVVGASLLPGDAEAGKDGGSGVVCEHAGHTCHAVVNGQTIHLLRN